MEKRFRIYTFMMISITIGVAKVKPEESSCLIKTIKHRFFVSRNCRLVHGVSMNLCIGACMSYDKYPLGYEGESCNCCQPISFKVRRVHKRQMLCLINGVKKVTINSFNLHEPTKCECKPCSRLT